MKTEEHYVYKITNINPTDTRHFYIGVRTAKNKSAEEDISYFGSSIPLDEAIEAEGANNFIKEILSVWNTRKEASLEEIRLHNIHDVAVNELYYNLAKATSTGFSRAGTKQTPEQVEKNRVSHLGRVWTEEQKEKNRQSHVGKKHSTEAKMRMAKNSTGEKNGMFGRKNSEETINKRVEKLKGQKRSDEIRNKMAIANKKTTTQEGYINGRTRLIILTDPDNNQYFICGNLRPFCKDRKLNSEMFRKMLRGTAQPGKRSSCYGWTVMEVKRIELE